MQNIKPDVKLALTGNDLCFRLSAWGSYLNGNTPGSLPIIFGFSPQNLYELLFRPALHLIAVLLNMSFLEVTVNSLIHPSTHVSIIEYGTFLALRSCLKKFMDIFIPCSH